ncbi:MAG: DEAD/DEAH box helicase [Rubrivivax sp.]|nr:DEAD/DEAH box helicase [Pyrinomonadaceae bacterium]
MNKEEYWSRTYARLSDLFRDPVFNNNLSQVKARAVQVELSSAPPAFTFDPKKIWQYCDYILSEGSLLLRENYGDRQELLKEIETAAQTFEHLYKFADEREKTILLLNAAMCYHIAGYQANAICITRLLEKRFQSNPSIENTTDSLLTEHFKDGLIKFLKRDIAGLRTATQKALFFINDRQSDVIENSKQNGQILTDVTNLTAHAYFQKSLSEFSRYCLYGAEVDFSVARENADTSYTYFQKASDVTLATITSELRAVLELFKERSTWTNISSHAGDLLNDRIWHIYLRNLAFDRSIVEFWLSQIRAVRGGLLTLNDGFVVQMPTSAGKTLIAELSILAALSKNENARCLYIAPFRALVNEIEKDLAANLGALGYRVSDLIGGFESDSFQEFLINESDVLVATPEKVELLLRTHPEYFQQLDVVVVDEGHILDEGIPTQEEIHEDETLLDELKEQGGMGRGVLLELLITRLRRQLPDCRFLFLSAVMPEVNAADFIKWLSKGHQEALKTDISERPSRQVIAKFSWQSEQNGRIDYFNLGQRTSTFVPYFLQRQQYKTGEVTAKGKPRVRRWPNIENKVQSTAMLSARFAEMGPVLVFCAQPNHVRSVTENLITSLRLLEASGSPFGDKLKYVDTPQLESYFLALEWLGEEHVLTQALHYGVGLHYGPLPDPVRQAVEDDFKRNNIHVLVSTSTLGQGVNLPIKTVIIYSLERRWGAGQQGSAKIKKRDFWNICGRAGRAGKETEGQIVFVVVSADDENLFKEYRDNSQLESVNSALYLLLKSLVEKRISQEELTGFLDSHVLALLAEEILETQDEEVLTGFLGKSLVGIQALSNSIDLGPLVTAFKATADWVREAVPDADSRRVFSSTGLSVESCKSIEEAVNLFIDGISQEILINNAQSTQCDKGLLKAAFDTCKDLREMRLRGNIDYLGPQDENSIIENWIGGRPINEFRSEFWDHGNAEGFSEYLADRLIYKLPWGFNGFLSILAFKLKQKHEDLGHLPLAWQYLPAMMKFGVNKVVACWASSLGISSRTLAVRVADVYTSQNEDSVNERNFIKWFANLPDKLVEELASTTFERNRLLQERNRIIPDRSHLLFLRDPNAKLEANVMGIGFFDVETANKVKQGDLLILKSEPDNPYDSNATQVLFEGQQIGYVERDKARIISKELRMGRDAHAVVKEVIPTSERSKLPRLIMSITTE